MLVLWVMCHVAVFKVTAECAPGLECVMFPGKELGQCKDINECTVSVSVPCLLATSFDSA